MVASSVPRLRLGDGTSNEKPPAAVLPLAFPLGSSRFLAVCLKQGQNPADWVGSILHIRTGASVEGAGGSSRTPPMAVGRMSADPEVIHVNNAPSCPIQEHRRSGGTLCRWRLVTADAAG